MKRTQVRALVLTGVNAAAVMLLLQVALGMLGYTKIVPPASIFWTLLLLAAIVVALAIPVYRATRLSTQRVVDPFYAIRVLLVAKASALAGALLSGAAAGIMVEIFLRPVASTSALSSSAVMLAGALILLAAGLVSENLCRVPPDDEQNSAELS